jgi:hypothetical protein
LKYQLGRISENHCIKRNYQNFQIQFLISEYGADRFCKRLEKKSQSVKLAFRDFHLICLVRLSQNDKTKVVYRN